MHVLRAGLHRFALAVLALAASALCARAQGTPARGCASPEYRQFDFWLGDWEVFDTGSTSKSADVRVDSILDGCVLREHYEDEAGQVGESFTVFDAGRKVWHQTWVTNRGRLLTIEGALQNGSIVLTGAYYLDNAKEVRVRGTWTRVADGVRETAVTSTDAGKTWKPWFDLSFRKRKEPRRLGLGSSDWHRRHGVVWLFSWCHPPRSMTETIDGFDSSRDLA